jgi:hypothetical protein
MQPIAHAAAYMYGTRVIAAGATAGRVLFLCLTQQLTVLLCHIYIY